MVRAVSPLSDEGKAALSKDKTDRLHLGDPLRGAADLTRGGRREHHRRDEPGRGRRPTVATGGYLGQAVSKADTESSEAVGLAAAVVILLFAFGTATAMAAPDRHRGPGSRRVALADRVPRPRGRGAERGAHARHDDRARRRDRLRALHRHPAQASAERRHGDAGVDRARHGHRGRRGGLRGRHGRDRAGVAARVGDPVRGHDGLQRGGGRRRRRAGRGHAPAGAPRRARPAHQLAAREARAHPSGRPPAARLGALGAAASSRGRGARSIASIAILVVLALPVLDLHMGSSDNGELPEEHDRAPGLRPDHRGLRRRARTARCSSASARQPAKPDQKQLNQVKQKQKQANQQQQQVTQQLSRGRPADQAHSRPSSNGLAAEARRRRSRPSHRPPTRG